MPTSPHPAPSAIIRGSVAGRPTRFLLDTAATAALIDSDLARAAGLAVEAVGQVVTRSGTVKEMEGTLHPRLAAGDWSESIDVLALIGPLPEPLRAAQIGVVLPPQALASQRAVVVDLHRDVLRATSSDEAWRALVGLRPLAARTALSGTHNPLALPVMMVDAQFEGVVGRVEIDTGSTQASLVRSSAAGRALRSARPPKAANTLDVVESAATEEAVDVAVAIGDVSRRTAVWLDASVDDLGCGREGSLGIDALKGCVIVIADGAFGVGCGSPAAPPVAPTIDRAW